MDKPPRWQAGRQWLSTRRSDDNALTAKTLEVAKRSKSCVLPWHIQTAFAKHELRGLHRLFMVPNDQQCATQTAMKRRVISVGFREILVRTVAVVRRKRINNRFAIL